MLPNNQTDPNKLFNYTFTTSSICNKCGKPFIYLGDIPYGGFIKGLEPYCICLEQEKEKLDYKKDLEKIKKNIKKQKGKNKMDSKLEKCKGKCLIQVKSDISLLFNGLTNLIEEVKQLEEELKKLKNLLEIG